MFVRNSTLLLIRKHSREDCLPKVRESHMMEKGREGKILEEEQVKEEAQMLKEEAKREWSREKGALYISPEISV